VEGEESVSAAARLTTRGLAAMAVINMALVFGAGGGQDVVTGTGRGRRQREACQGKLGGVGCQRRACHGMSWQWGAWGRGHGQETQMNAKTSMLPSHLDTVVVWKQVFIT
jgi:hypothetical protein